MNEAEQKKFIDVMEWIAISEGLLLLIQQAESSGMRDAAHEALLTFLKALYSFYKRKAAGVKIKTDSSGDVRVIDEQLRRFFDN